jgi:hypothetical protein
MIEPDRELARVGPGFLYSLYGGLLGGLAGESAFADETPSC